MEEWFWPDSKMEESTSETVGGKGYCHFFEKWGKYLKMSSTSFNLVGRCDTTDNFVIVSLHFDLSSTAFVSLRS